MRFGKCTLFLFLNGLIAFILLCYSFFWFWSDTVMGTLQRPYFDNVVTVRYTVGGKNYVGTYMRNGIPYGEGRVTIRYHLLQPSLSRINSFLGMAAEPLAWWLVFLMASSILLLTNNTVFSKGCVFRLHRGFPWISMDEYYPMPGSSWHRNDKEPPKSKSRQPRLLE